MEKKQRLNEVLAVNNKLPFALKFSSKKNLESLQNGTLYLNNFQYYKDLEITEKRKGQGDAFDASLRISDVNLTFKHPETGETLFTGRASNASMESNEDYQKHLFCMTGITTDLLEIVHIEDNVAVTKLVLPQELKERALENFGDHVMCINIGHFLNRVEQVCRDKNIAVVRNAVEYRDMSINYTDRMEAFATSRSDFFFQKDIFFAYQNEYRILFPELISDKPEIIDIGNIEKFTNILPTKTLIEGELQLSFHLTEE
ncbi:hypothetical protein FZC76_20730 [Sutcliffiella horikoshii]|uniref:Uncharacterized protein n=1 Tax=Sutcliffiella horikoshii TaxID=79883 RepID=A0A5D4SGY8_9BACI|nr:hypothetical protein [Sutcliffiella horikoshii]TYS62529.1 hypothetical protein FZC76_20730 [Sutcliffiella horikoshii]